MGEPIQHKDGGLVALTFQLHRGPCGGNGDVEDFTSFTFVMHVHFDNIAYVKRWKEDPTTPLTAKEDFKKRKCLELNHVSVCGIANPPWWNWAPVSPSTLVQIELSRADARVVYFRRVFLD